MRIQCEFCDEVFGTPFEYIAHLEDKVLHLANNNKKKAVKPSRPQQQSEEGFDEDLENPFDDFSKLK